MKFIKDNIELVCIVVSIVIVVVFWWLNHWETGFGPGF